MKAMGYVYSADPTLEAWAATVCPQWADRDSFDLAVAALAVANHKKLLRGRIHAGHRTTCIAMMLESIVANGVHTMPLAVKLRELAARPDSMGRQRLPFAEVEDWLVRCGLVPAPQKTRQFGEQWYAALAAREGCSLAEAEETLEGDARGGEPLPFFEARSRAWGVPEDACDSVR